MNEKCPFIDLFNDQDQCPYMKDTKCDEIEVNQGNGDAWCRKKIEEGIFLETKQKEA